MWVETVLPHAIQTYQTYVTVQGSGRVVRSFLLGAGLCYSIEQQKLWHIPSIVTMPTVYAGYQLYKQREAVARWLV
jgi:hypothetical protein